MCIRNPQAVLGPTLVKMRYSAAKDRTFKTVRPNQGTRYGDDEQAVACDRKVPAWVWRVYGTERPIDRRRKPIELRDDQRLR
jgi:hypothetical protein